MYSPPHETNFDVLIPGGYPPIMNLVERIERTLLRTFYPPGHGYLAGSFPDGITSVEGTPSPAIIRVLHRAPGFPFDGVVVAETTSAPDGTWLVEGLDHTLKYDVICRHEGYNDMILSNVSPHSLPHLYDVHIWFDIGVPSDHTFLPYAGTPPYTVELKSGVLPEGVALVDNVLVGDWPTGQAGGYQVVFTVTDSVGGQTDRPVMIWLILQSLVLTTNHDVPGSYLVDRPIIPIVFEARGGEGPYTLSIEGGLPAGLSFDDGTGVLSGSPTETGSYTFSVEVVDARGQIVEEFFDVEVLEPIEILNTNLALNKSISSNNTISYQNSSSSPVNGNINSSNYTSFGSGEGWLSVDLGAIYNINTIKVWFYWLDGRRYHDKRVQFSVDGNVWETVYDDTTSPPYNETSAGRTFTFSKSPARYVRVITNGNTVNTSNHIIELQAFLNEPL